MKADEMRVGPLLDGPTLYVVPYFQRAYSWRKRQWTTLLDDILELYQLGSHTSHFLGSMVLLAENNEASGQPQKLVIDGQQRIVTLSLLLAAIRDISSNSDPSFANRLHERFLLHDGEVKFLTTHQDRAAFATVIKTGNEPEPSPIRDAYRTFKDSLKTHIDQGLDLDRLVNIVISQLSFVA